MTTYRAYRNSVADTPKARLIAARAYVDRDEAEATRTRAIAKGHRARIYARTVKADRVEIDIYALIVRER